MLPPLLTGNLEMSHMHTAEIQRRYADRLIDLSIDGYTVD
jgi:hypothetical protein